MRVRFSAEVLPARACDDGRRRLAKVFPEGVDVEWTQQHALWAALEFRYVRYLVEKGIVPPLDLRGMDLRNVDLRKIKERHMCDFDLAQVRSGQWLPEGWENINGRMVRARS